MNNGNDVSADRTESFDLSKSEPIMNLWALRLLDSPDHKDAPWERIPISEIYLGGFFDNALTCKLLIELRDATAASVKDAEDTSEVPSNDNEVFTSVLSQYDAANRKGIETLGEYWHFLKDQGAPLPKIPECLNPERLSAEFSPTLVENLKLLQELYSVSELGQKIFTFIRACEDHPFLKRVLEFREHVRAVPDGMDNAIALIASALGEKRSAVKAELVRGSLASGQFVQSVSTGTSAKDCELFSDYFDCGKAVMFPSGDLTLYTESILAVFKPCIIDPDEKQLFTFRDFRHVSAIENVLTPYLKATLKDLPDTFDEDSYYAEVGSKNKIPPNILIWGPKDAGKSAIMHLLAHELHETVYQYNAADCKDQDKRLLGLYAITRNMRDCGHKILVILNAEEYLHDTDLVYLNTDDQDDKGKAQERFDWRRKHLGRILANNRIPTIWLADDLNSLYFNYEDYFALSIEVKPSEERLRREEIEGIFTSTKLTEDAVQWLTEQKDVSLEHMDRVANIANAIGFDQHELGTNVLYSLIYAALPPTDERDELPKFEESQKESDLMLDGYDPHFINCNFDPEELALGLKRAGHGRLCLYGPPGTGKSVYAAYIAKVIGRPLMRKNYSDLARPRVGDTEQLIDYTFSQALEKKAVLLIDEADSFLKERVSSQYAWEVTAVNEMLCQMEKFNDGYFVATTNLMDSMDKACLRRFDLKAKFDYMTEDQVGTFAQKFLKDLKLEYDDEVISALMKMSSLTPGDFHAIKRQNEFFPLRSAKELLARIRREVLFKQTSMSQKSIGFCV